MRIDVIFSPSQVTAPLVAGKTVAVIDVLRASTSIAVALANGAKAVVPLESADEVITRAKAFERADVVLAGERRMQPIAGFDCGNSPLEFTAATVESKTVLLTTTNGTRALLAVQAARDVVIASYANFTAALERLRAAANGENDVILLCAGRERQFALEDAACAGRLARHLAKGDAPVEISDSTQASILIDRRYGDRLDRLFLDAEHGRALKEAGYVADLRACAALDTYPVVPVYAERQITRVATEREG